MNDPVKDLLKMAKDKVNETPNDYPEKFTDRINVLIALIRDFKSNQKRSGSEIKDLREKLGLSLRQLATKTGLSYETVRLHENNHFARNITSINNHNKILKYLNS